MRRLYSPLIALLLGVVFALPATSRAQDEVAAPIEKKESIVTIGTGSVTGVYYPAGGAICRLLGQEKRQHGIRCLVESTGGSIYNIRSLRDHELDMAIVQSDWQYDAYNGGGMFGDGPPFKDLRSIFSLHSEMFTLVATKKSNIRKLSDLKGKRVNIGDRGSGMRATMQDIMEEMNWTKRAFSEATELKPADAAQALCVDKIDAMVFTAGHPNGLMQEIVDNCGAVMVPVEGTEVERLVANHSYYARTFIPGGMYKSNKENVKTFGVKATLVTTADMSEEVVYQLVKAVFANFDYFKTLHFVFATLDKDRMIATGLTAPMHPGALRYYLEMGMIKEDPPEAAGSGPGVHMSPPVALPAEAKEKPVSP